MTVIISDNASTDGTAGVCRELAATDPRVRYYRQTRNVGLYGNWQSLVHHLASEKYALLLPDDDLLCDPTYLRRAVIVAEEAHLSAVFSVIDLADSKSNKVLRPEFDIPLRPPPSWWAARLGRHQRGVALFPSFATVFNVQAARHLHAYEPGVYGLDSEFQLRLMIAAPVGFLPGHFYVGVEHEGNDHQVAPVDEVLRGLGIFKRTLDLVGLSGQSHRDWLNWRSCCDRLIAIYARHLLAPAWLRQQGSGLGSLAALNRVISPYSRRAAYATTLDPRVVTTLLLGAHPGFVHALRRAWRTVGGGPDVRQVEDWKPSEK